MTILLYDYYELEEKSSKTLKLWKAWHLILFLCAGIFGLLNFTFLQYTMQLVDNNCVLSPRALEFHIIARDNFTDATNRSNTTNSTTIYVEDVTTDRTVKNETVAQTTADGIDTKVKVTKRETVANETKDNNDKIDNNDKRENTGQATRITGNRTHHLVLDTERSLFGGETDCQFAEFMPILSTIFSLVWLTMFTMCPGGGRVRTGLPQPWRIMMPAMLFTLVMVGLMGHSFNVTDGGLQDFCTAFYNVTNSTKCTPVNEFLASGWNATWGFGGRASWTRAASAGAWASWACAAALLAARCILAPDFQVKRSRVYLSKDPQQIITPFLKKTRRRSNRSNQNSPTKRDNVSIKSEPTVTTELATVSVEPGQDSAPTSLMATPVKKDRDSDGIRDSELIELSYTPQERREDYV